ncbi:hypothetical protein E2C01_055068 [Portunus trituberculatus]|uniref:Uncharacterized protein n=1 Tax=Portunus trituberculatus TaxID=210409 RepID=A0A5B7GTT8_PORTR|nr:hypothetical protein [Portunus trituberculatus]
MQSNQLKSVSKEEVTDSFLSCQEDAALQTITAQLDSLMNDITDMKKTITQDSTVLKIAELQSQVDRQAEIIAK